MFDKLTPALFSKGNHHLNKSITNIVKVTRYKIKNVAILYFMAKKPFLCFYRVTAWSRDSYFRMAA